MKRLLMVLIPLITIMSGCANRDDRLGNLAERVVTEQSQQNVRNAEQTEQIAAASRELVEADARSRQAIVEAHQTLQSDVAQQRSIVDSQRDALEEERRQLARQRQQAPVVGNAIGAAGLLVAAVLPLVLGIYLLRYLVQSPEPAVELVELLTENVVHDLPRLPHPNLAEPHESSDQRRLS